jgi:hypothetical protein
MQRIFLLSLLSIWQASGATCQEQSIEVWKNGGGVNLELDTTALNAKVFKIDNKFFNAYVRPLSLEEFQATGMNYEYCGGNKVFLLNPRLVEAPDHLCKEKGLGDQFPFMAADFAVAADVSIYNAAFEEVGTFKTLSVKEGTVSGVVYIADGATGWSYDQLSEFARDLKSGEGVIAAESGKETYIMMQNPLFSLPQLQ